MLAWYHHQLFLQSHLEAVLSQQLGLPHVLPIRKAIRNPNPAEVLDAFLQLLLWRYFLFVCFPLGGLSFADPKGPHAEQISLAAHFCLLQHVNWSFGQGAVQGLNVGPPAHRATNHSSLRGAGLRLGLRTGSGELIEGSAALSLAIALVTFAAAVTVGGKAFGRSAYRKTESPHRNTGVSGFDHAQ